MAPFMKHGAGVTLLPMLLGSCVPLCVGVGVCVRVCVHMKVGEWVCMHAGVVCGCLYKLQLAHMCVQREAAVIMSGSNNCGLRDLYGSQLLY